MVDSEEGQCVTAGSGWGAGLSSAAEIHGHVTLTDIGKLAV